MRYEYKNIDSLIFQVRQRDTDSKVISPSIIEEAQTMDNVSRL